MPVVVHGGGPVIRKMLELAQIESEFVEGHRITTAEAMKYTEMALSGNINGQLVSLINSRGGQAVGLSGKDGGTATAVKRMHKKDVDLGFVGDIEVVNPRLLRLLLSENYIPVISPVSADKNGDTYNINADMFAGHTAGALNAAHYIALTDVEGILTDKDDASTLLETMTVKEIESETGNLIEGGMIPKTESCIIALKNGTKFAHIMNGTKPDNLTQVLIKGKNGGTLITV